MFLYLGKTTTELGEFCGHVCLKASAAEKRERRRSSSRADEKTEMENFETEIRKILYLLKEILSELFKIRSFILF